MEHNETRGILLLLSIDVQEIFRHSQNRHLIIQKNGAVLQVETSKHYRKIGIWERATKKIKHWWPFTYGQKNEFIFILSCKKTSTPIDAFYCHYIWLLCNIPNPQSHFLSLYVYVFVQCKLARVEKKLNFSVYLFCKEFRLMWWWLGALENPGICTQMNRKPE